MKFSFCNCIAHLFNKPAKNIFQFTTLTLKNCLCLFCCIVFASCSQAPQMGGGTEAEISLRAETQSRVNESFEAKGQAGLDRLKQDSTQRYCSTQRSAKDVTAQSSTEQIEQIRLENLALITQPKDSNYFGDFQAGERIAQDGRGKTWSDPFESQNGGNCYNCHQLTKKEVSYGTLGPSLYQYGKLRGVKDMQSFTEKSNQASTDSLIQYTWGVLMNSKAFDVCTAMPRFGVTFKNQGAQHATPILNEQQIKDLMSLLLDPRSPVNQ